MSWNSIKRRRADILYSLYLRKARNYTCEHCGVVKPDGHGLEISHFWGRANESVRFDPENTDVFCHRCALYFSTSTFERNGKAEYAAWKEKMLGRQAFDLLMLRANRAGKRDDRLIIAWLKEVEKPQTLYETFKPEGKKY